jgi:hypothetical protein
VHARCGRLALLRGLQQRAAAVGAAALQRRELRRAAAFATPQPVATAVAAAAGGARSLRRCRLAARGLDDVPVAVQRDDDVVEASAEVALARAEEDVHFLHFRIQTSEEHPLLSHRGRVAERGVRRHRRLRRRGGIAGTKFNLSRCEPSLGFGAHGMRAAACTRASHACVRAHARAPGARATAECRPPGGSSARR